VLEQLERGADPVGEPLHLGVADAEDAEHDPADGVGGESAVAQQVGEGGVAVYHLVLQVGLHEAVEGLGRQAAVADDRQQPAEHRVLGPGPRGGPGPDPVEVGVEGSQRRGAVAGKAVAELVDGAGERVDGMQRLPVAPGQQPQGDREVLAVLPPAQFARVLRDRRERSQSSVTHISMMETVFVPTLPFW
jgi:hypothetical protein